MIITQLNMFECLSNENNYPTKKLHLHAYLFIYLFLNRTSKFILTLHKI